MIIAPPAVRLYGSRTFQLEGKKRTSSPRKLDALSLSWQTDSEDTFINGGPMPGYPLMEIEECETVEEIPGIAYTHNLRGKGLLRAGHKLESSNLKQPDEGWDEGPQTWLTTDPTAFAIGNQHPDIASLWCVGLDDIEKVTAKVSRISASYRGIIPDSSGNPKPGKWKGTVNGETTSTSSTISLGVAATWVRDENGVFNGWEDQRKAQIDSSTVSVIHTLLSFTAPPTNKVGLSYTPARVPLMFNIYDQAGWYSAAGFTWNWPPGWKLSGVQWDQILDKEIYLYTLTHTYVPKFKPNL
jgi:hypothetical protein